VGVCRGNARLFFRFFNFGGFMTPAQSVQLKVVTIETVLADKIVGLTATLESGAVAAIQGPVSVDDYFITKADGSNTVLSQANFNAELVQPVAGH
jgi:hypothetical protein